MNPIHSLARTCIAPIFLTGGLDALMHPDSKIAAAEKVVPQLHSLGFTGSPSRLVRVNGGVQLVAGFLLFAGVFPRTASAALAASMVPTTLAGHRFWEAEDADTKSAQRIQFLKNAALFGGLVLAATDRNGSPSMAWRAKRGVRHASHSLQSAKSDVVSRVSHDSLTDKAGALGDKAAAMGDKVREAATPWLERGLEAAGSAGSSAGDILSNVGETVHTRTNSLIRSLS
jgi:uncharacterized membrane protein YphA (DoxX/SURF4 family)